MLIFKYLFHTIETNPNTLRHLVSKKLDGYHHYPIIADWKDALCWWNTQE
jgi:hypothetical protein